MRHLLQETEFGCIPTSIAMVTGLTVRQLIHGIQEPWHFDSFNERLLSLRWAPIIYSHVHPLDKDCVLYLAHGHAVAWSVSDQYALDPNGGKIVNLPEIDFVQRFIKMI